MRWSLRNHQTNEDWSSQYGKRREPRIRGRDVQSSQQDARQYGAVLLTVIAILMRPENATIQQIVAAIRHLRIMVSAYLVHLDQPRPPSRLLARNHRCARATEWIEHETRVLLLLARSTSSTGYMVGCRSFLCGFLTCHVVVLHRSGRRCRRPGRLARPTPLK